MSDFSFFHLTTFCLKLLVFVTEVFQTALHINKITSILLVNSTIVWRIPGSVGRYSNGWEGSLVIFIVSLHNGHHTIKQNRVLLFDFSFLILFDLLCLFIANLRRVLDIFTIDNTLSYCKIYSDIFESFEVQLLILSEYFLHDWPVEDADISVHCKADYYC